MNTLPSIIPNYYILSNKKIESLVDTIVTKPTNGNVGFKKKGKEREFHINTRWENFKHLFDQCREDFKDLCAFLNDKFESNDPYKNDPWRDEHYWDLYR